MSFTHDLRIKCRRYKRMLKSIRYLRTPPDLTFLMYHSVTNDEKSNYIYPKVRTDPADFEQDLKYIASKFNVISIDDYFDSINSGKLLPARSLMISFDDGYLDNLEYALPLLKSFDMPAVLYLATQYIDNCEPQWVDRLYSILRYAGKNHGELNFLGNKNWDIGDLSERHLLFSILNNLMITQTYDQRIEMLDHLTHIFDFQDTIPRLTLNWDEVTAISAEFPNIELGIHTDQHLDLCSHKGNLADELIKSSEKITRASNHLPVHFSYPYGRAFGGSHVYLEAHGIHTAVCSVPDYYVSPEKSHYYLPRIDAVQNPRRQWWYSNPQV